MKTATTTRKAANSPKKSRWGQKLTPAQKASLESMFADIDQVFGGRDTGSTDFLIKLRRGEG